MLGASSGAVPAGELLLHGGTHWLCRFPVDQRILLSCLSVTINLFLFMVHPAQSTQLPAARSCIASRARESRSVCLSLLVLGVGREHLQSWAVLSAAQDPAARSLLLSEAA